MLILDFVSPTTELNDHSILLWIFWGIIFVLFLIVGFVFGTIYSNHAKMWEDYKDRMSKKELERKQEERERSEFEDFKKEVKGINEKYGKLESDFRHIKSELETLNKNLPTMQIKLFEMLEGAESLIDKILEAKNDMK